MQVPIMKEFGRTQSLERQKQHARDAIARGGETRELDVMELEERIAPKLASNHNETLLVEA